MNVKPKNYSWPEFYDHVIDLTEYSVSWDAIRKRFFSGQQFTAQWLNVVRAISSEGFGRIKFFREVQQRLKSDFSFRDFFEGESSVLPDFYHRIIRKDLSYAWNWLPQNALSYDHLAYLRKTPAD